MVSETVITECGTITIRKAAAYTVGPVASKLPPVVPPEASRITNV